MLTAAFLAFLIVAAVAQAARQPHSRTLTEPSAGGVEGSVGQSAGRYAGPNRIAAIGVTGQEVGLTAPGSASVWHQRFLRMRHLAYERGKRVKQLKRTLMSAPTVSEAINLAGAVYGNTTTLWQLARCESTLNPNAQNPSGSSGLFQFMPSTFASTPFGRFSIWSPYANALAGGWMLAHGRRSEWVC